MTSTSTSQFVTSVTLRNFPNRSSWCIANRSAVYYNPYTSYSPLHFKHTLIN